MKSSIFISILVAAAAWMLASCGHKAAVITGLDTTEEISVKLASTQSLRSSADIQASGLVSTANEAKYAFKIGGVITRIFFNEGQFFKKGRLLATLDSTEISADLQQAALNLEKAKRDYTRASNLYRDSVATLEQMQNARTSLDVAQKAKDAIAFNAQYSRIYATSDGFVTKKIGNEGEVIAAGTPVMAVNETSGNGDYTLKVGVTDQEWASIRLNQKAVITLDGFPGVTINAFVFRKSQAADQSDGSFQIELKMMLKKNLAPAIGMFGKARILADTGRETTLIPYDALIEADGDKAFVFAPTDDNHVKRVPIVIEKFDNNEVYVKSGLENTPKIVISNSAFLNEQSIVKIINR